jgi:2,4'-dihydroxyacetophenone dioxygenase
MSTAATTYAFDQSNIRWFPLGDFKNLELSMLAVDRPNKIVDFIVRFHARGAIFAHRHLAETHLFVVQGEHLIYELDGSLKEVRKTGSYTLSAPGGVHTEGAGDVDCIVIYNIRGNGSDEMFDVLDDAGQIVGKINFDDFASLYEAQKADSAAPSA